MTVQEPKQGKSGDSQHWYSRDGKPAHDQPNKSKPGEFRPTTLRDARSQNLLPSVSSILAVMVKPGLNGWIKEQVAGAAVDLAADDQLPLLAGWDECVSTILNLAESRMSKARDLGTEIHGAIERYLIGGPNLGNWSIGDDWAHFSCIKAAVAALKELGVWGQPFEAEKTFASPLGYGGTLDFKANPITLSGVIVDSGVIADFKCVDSLSKRLAYTDRCAQLCGYAMGIAPFPNPNPDYWLANRLVNIFISTSEPGKYLIHEWTPEDKEHGWKLFSAAFNLWQVSNRYYPATLSQTAQSS